MHPQSYSQFFREALYGPQGYYTSSKPRVGRSHDLNIPTDFYTSSSIPLFPRLLAQAFKTLAELHRLDRPTLIELGNEPHAPLFPTAPKDFASSLNFPLGTLCDFQTNIDSRPASMSHHGHVVFSNELFDAQPIERLRKTKNGWELLGLDPPNKILDLVIDKNFSPPFPLPQNFPTGSVIDISFDALKLIDNLFSPPPAGNPSTCGEREPLAASEGVASPTRRSCAAVNEDQTSRDSDRVNFQSRETPAQPQCEAGVCQRGQPAHFDEKNIKENKFNNNILGATPLSPSSSEPHSPCLFIAFDYGLSLAELLAHPRPTARAYHQHRSLTLAEALSLPTGSYDLTHHVIWDLLADRLRAHGFTVQPLMTQEAFFVHYSAGIFPTLTPVDRAQLATLLHPAHMGAAFQVLIASR